MTLPTPLQDFFLAQQWTVNIDVDTSNDVGDQPKPLVVVSLIQDNARVNLCRNPLTKKRRHHSLPSRWNSGTTSSTACNSPRPCYHRRSSPDAIDDALISALVDHLEQTQADAENVNVSLDSPRQKPWRKRSTKKQDQPPMSPSRKHENWPSTRCALSCAVIDRWDEDCPELLHVEHQQARQAPSAA